MPTRPRTGLLGRVAFFLTLSVGWNGYEFGRADHGIHLVFVDRLLHPGRWQGDFLDRAADHHPSLVWWLEASLSSLVGMPVAFGLLHLAALITTALSIEFLVRSLGGKTPAVLLSLALLAPAQFSLAGIATLDPLFLPRGSALPLEIFSLGLLVKRRHRDCFLLLGLAACLHAPSAAGLAVACSLVVLYDTCKPKQRWNQEEPLRSSLRSLVTPLWFFLSATPVLLLWILQPSSEAAISQVDPQWLAIVDARLGHHIDPASWPKSDWSTAGLWLAIGGLSAASSTTLIPFRRWSLVVVTGLIVWGILAGSLLARLLHVDLALQLEPWECFRLVTVCCSVFLAIRMGDTLRNAGWGKTALTYGVFLGLSLLVSRATVEHNPTWLPEGKKSEERELVEAAASRLPPGSKVLWPPQGFEYDRWRAQVPGTPSWKDGGESLFDRQLAQEWLELTREVCACSPLDFTAENDFQRLTTLRVHIQRSWEDRTEAELRASAQRLGATHLILQESQREERASEEPGLAPGRNAPTAAAGRWVLLPISSAD